MQIHWTARNTVLWTYLQQNVTLQVNIYELASLLSIQQIGNLFTADQGLRLLFPRIDIIWKLERLINLRAWYGKSIIQRFFNQKKNRYSMRELKSQSVRAISNFSEECESGLMSLYTECRVSWPG